MRLKFRAWDTRGKRMYKVGQLTLDELASWNFKSDREDEMIGVSPFLQPHIKIMQSTGMRDKNDKEIFEGDIVKPTSFARWIGTVEYSPDHAAFILKDHNNDFLRSEPVFLSQFTEGLKVLGNIYENPELLEKISKEK